MLSGPQCYCRPGTGSGEEFGLEPEPQLTPLPLETPSPAPKGRGFRVQQGEAEPSGWGWAGRAPWQHARAARPVTLHEQGGKVRALSPRHAPFAPASGGLPACSGFPVPGDLSVPPALERELGVPSSSLPRPQPCHPSPDRRTGGAPAGPPRTVLGPKRPEPAPPCPEPGGAGPRQVATPAA